MRNRNTIKRCSPDQFPAVSECRFFNSPFACEIRVTITPDRPPSGKRLARHPSIIRAGGANRDSTKPLSPSNRVPFSYRNQLHRRPPSAARGPPTPSESLMMRETCWRSIRRRSAAARRTAQLAISPKPNRDFCKTQRPNRRGGGIRNERR